VSRSQTQTALERAGQAASANDLIADAMQSQTPALWTGLLPIVSLAIANQLNPYWGAILQEPRTM
jgi:hypothetical protein